MVLGGIALAGIGVSAWLATRLGAQHRQEGLARTLNHPPQPVAAVFRLVNPLLRPWPLAVLAVVLLGWVVLTSGSRRDRLEILRATVVSAVVAEATAQALKRLARQPRPLAVLADLDAHGYPRQPAGNAYPSAHTALVVALACALWPWMDARQRTVAVVVAVLVPLNRAYIGAHWPIDLVGGIAAGLLAGATAWLVAAGWPIRAGTGDDRASG